MFGSLLNIFQESILWHGFITILIVFLVEMVNYFIYNSAFSIHEKKVDKSFVNSQKLRTSFPGSIDLSFMLCIKLRKILAIFLTTWKGLKKSKIFFTQQPPPKDKLKNRGFFTKQASLNKKIQSLRFTVRENSPIKNICFYQHRYNNIFLIEKPRINI